MKEYGLKIKVFVDDKELSRFKVFENAVERIGRATKRVNVSSGLGRLADEITRARRGIGNLERDLLNVKNAANGFNRSNFTENLEKLNKLNLRKSIANLKGLSASAKITKKAVDDLTASLMMMNKVSGETKLSASAGAGFYTDKLKELRQTDRMLTDVNRKLKNYNKLNGTVAVGVRSLNSSAVTITSLLGVATSKFAILYATIRTLGFAKKSFETIQDGMINIAKTTNMAKDDLVKLKLELETLATSRVGYAIEDTLDIAASAGQMGIRGIQNIKEFTDTIQMMVLTTEMAAPETAESMSKIATVMKLPIKQVKNLGSALNELTNNDPTTMAPLIDMLSRVANEGQRAGIHVADLAAMSSVLISSGIRAESGGTSLSKMIQSLTVNADKLQHLLGGKFDFMKNFKKDMKNSPMKAIQNFLKSVNMLDTTPVSALFKELGLNGERARRAVLTLANQQEHLAKSMKLSENGFKNGMSLISEYNKRLDSLKDKQTRFSTSMKILAADLFDNIDTYLGKMFDFVSKEAHLLKIQDQIREALQKSKRDKKTTVDDDKKTARSLEELSEIIEKKAASDTTGQAIMSPFHIMTKTYEEGINSVKDLWDEFVNGVDPEKIEKKRFDEKFNEDIVNFYSKKIAAIENLMEGNTNKVELKALGDMLREVKIEAGLISPEAEKAGKALKAAGKEGGDGAKTAAQLLEELNDKIQTSIKLANSFRNEFSKAFLNKHDYAVFSVGEDFRKMIESLNANKEVYAMAGIDENDITALARKRIADINREFTIKKRTAFARAIGTDLSSQLASIRASRYALEKEGYTSTEAMRLIQAKASKVIRDFHDRFAAVVAKATMNAKQQEVFSLKQELERYRRQGMRLADIERVKQRKLLDIRIKYADKYASMMDPLVKTEIGAKLSALQREFRNLRLKSGLSAAQVDTYITQKRIKIKRDFYQKVEDIRVKYAGTAEQNDILSLNRELQRYKKQGVDLATIEEVKQRRLAEIRKKYRYAYQDAIAPLVMTNEQKERMMLERKIEELKKLGISQDKIDRFKILTEQKIRLTVEGKYLSPEEIAQDARYLRKTVSDGFIDGMAGSKAKHAVFNLGYEMSLAFAKALPGMLNNFGKTGSLDLSGTFHSLTAAGMSSGNPYAMAASAAAEVVSGIFSRDRGHWITADEINADKAITSYLPELVNKTGLTSKYSADMRRILANIEANTASSAFKLKESLAEKKKEASSSSHLLGFSKSKTTVEGVGITGGAYTLDQILSGAFAVYEYQNKKKSSSSLFGVISHSKKYTTKEESDAIKQLVSSIADGYISVLNREQDRIGHKLFNAGKATLDIGTVDLTGKSDDEIVKLIDAKISDSISAAVNISANSAFRKAGEDNIQYLSRIAAAEDEAITSLATAGVKLIDPLKETKDGLYAIKDGLKEISGSEFVKYTLKATDARKGLTDALDSFTGSADETIEAYKKMSKASYEFWVITDGIYDSITQKMIDGAGTLDRLVSGQTVYMDYFTSTEDRLSASRERVSKDFEKVGETMPKTAEQFRMMVESIAKAGDDEHYGQVVALAPELKETIELEKKLTEERKKSVKDLTKQVRAMFYQSIDVSAKAKQAYSLAVFNAAVAKSDREEIVKSANDVLKYTGYGYEAYLERIRAINIAQKAGGDEVVYNFRNERLETITEQVREENKQIKAELKELTDKFDSVIGYNGILIDERR